MGKLSYTNESGSTAFEGLEEQVQFHFIGEFRESASTQDWKQESVHGGLRTLVD